MTRLLALLVLISAMFVGAPAASAYVPPVTRAQVSLDAGWRFLRADAAGAEAPGFNDSAWTSVNVPHTWNAQDGQDGGSNYYRGIGWYRKHFTPSATLSGRRLWLQFDGVNQVADVWVNGVKLGQHRGGFAGFRYDVTSALKLGQDNVIAVRADNRAVADVAPLSADFTFFGGIYRNVSLTALDLLGVRMGDSGGPGVYLRQRSLSDASASVEVTTKAWNNRASAARVKVRTVVVDHAGVIVGESVTATRSVNAATGFDTVQTLTIPRPHRWNGKADPYLYRASVEIIDADTGVVKDVVTEPLGLRTTAVDAGTGFSLNGRPLRLNGVNAHQDRLNAGWAVTQADQRQDFDLMDEMGVNALRTAHYQQAEHVYDLADQRGYVVWTEIPLVNEVTDSAAFRANAQQQLLEMIRQNFNHPSIAFWGIGNEQKTSNTATNNLLRDLAASVRAEDSGRHSTYASHIGDRDPVSSHAELAAYNKYYGWYDNSSTGPGGWADRLHAADPARKIALSEYGAGGSIAQHEESPKPPVTTSRWHPEEYQTLVHENSWAQLKTRSFLWGTFVWNMFDFAVDSRSEGDTLGRNDKGLVTYDRAVRKDSFYLYKANWTNTPFVHLNSARWTQRTTAATTVRAYGTTDNVQLTLNGVAVGAPKPPASDHIYTWPITLRPGANTVTITGTRDGRAYTDTATWTLT
ncbi:glycoside hydrolase family 2 TIM barrel-domain containing protein [Lentzea sp. BCCO 10_0856]|uniref:Glycoside hydrolase family 2 TIM barrel-domain containing protein n=1 Tax=Lentzea miocenica TaxID=3095431 RepID=A0ABU4T5J9_9PSEU|nr:glycoside hydrolase family 2 TIM barrel-domain containing protein [Lentzea sp. BCCO 10_0856]MDX8033252.1 glycoside hydrolase family 2 TIM barrel-domain containing protein [Lentzea sp. BCCO 10_0856]